MYRFHDYLLSRSADFWRTYYQNVDLIQLFSYTNSTLGAEIGGYPLLQAYDILGVANHLPGRTAVWEPITLVYTGTSSARDYPYDYAIPYEWIDIDALYDKPTDPELKYQKLIDFRIRKPGTISFAKVPQKLQLLVSKGQLSDTRLADNFGRMFGYARRDSYYYRDSMVPLMALFYLGPTLPLIRSGFAISMKYPVTKYGDEIVQQVTQDYVVTNKYEYSTNNARVSVTPGTHLAVPNKEHIWPAYWAPPAAFTRYQSLVDAVRVYTNKTDPGWWQNLNPMLFQRFSDGPELSPHQRDLLMDTFLKRYVALVRLSYKLIDPTNFKLQQDVIDLVYDAMPIRSAFILSANYDIEDPMIDPVKEIVAFSRIVGRSLWTGWPEEEGTDLVISAPKVVQPKILADDATEATPGFWPLGRRYHILERSHQFYEFWSVKPELYPYVEPTYSEVFYRQTADKPVGHHDQITATDFFDVSFHPATLEKGMVALRDPDLITSNLRQLLTPKSFIGSTAIVSVKNPMFITLADLQGWTLEGAARLGAFGIDCQYSNSGSAVSTGIDIGSARQKQVKVTIQADAPTGTALTMLYAANDGDWSYLPPDNTIPSVSGILKFKVLLTGTEEKVPTLRGLILDIKQL